MRYLLSIVLLALASTVHAQTEERGSAPLGQSRDGAGPADGALKGGTILPGESAGIPNDKKTKQRCEELSGSLREDCLKQEREARLPSDTRRLPTEPAGSAAGSSSSPR
jgi:hypothetical protein